MCALMGNRKYFPGNFLENDGTFLGNRKYCRKCDFRKFPGKYFVLILFMLFRREAVVRAESCTKYLKESLRTFQEFCNLCGNCLISRKIPFLYSSPFFSSSTASLLFAIITSQLSTKNMIVCIAESNKSPYASKDSKLIILISETTHATQKSCRNAAI